MVTTSTERTLIDVLNAALIVCISNPSAPTCPVVSAIREASRILALESPASWMSHMRWKIYDTYDALTSCVFRYSVSAG